MKQVNKDELNKCNSVAEFNTNTLTIMYVVYLLRRINKTDILTLANLKGKLLRHGVMCLFIFNHIVQDNHFKLSEYRYYMSLLYSSQTVSRTLKYYFRLKVIKWVSNDVCVLTQAGIHLLSVFNEVINSIHLPELARQQK